MEKNKTKMQQFLGNAGDAVLKVFSIIAGGGVGNQFLSDAEMKSLVKRDYPDNKNVKCKSLTY